jgi:hypothetical protein
MRGQTTVRVQGRSSVASSSPAPVENEEAVVRPIALFAAVWMSLVFFERLVYDNYLYRYGPGQRAMKRSITPGAVLVFLAGVPLLTLAVALRPESLWRLGDGFAHFTGLVGEMLASPTFDVVLIAAAVFMTLAVAMVKGRSLLWVFKQVRERLWQTIKDWALVLASAAVVGLYWLVALLVLNVRGKETTAAAYLALFASGAVIGTYCVLMLVVFQVDVGRRLPKNSTTQAFAASGMLKDVIIYGVIALFVGSGLVKFESAMHEVSISERWHDMGLMAIAALVVAMVVGGGDLIFAERVVLQPEHWSRVWPHEWQRRAVHRHVYLRDFGLLIPGILVMFGWLALKIAQSPN